MPARLPAVLLCLAAVCVGTAYSQSITVGATLILDTCDLSSPLQQLSITAKGTVATPDGTLCVTFMGDSPLPLGIAACDSSVSQQWSFDASNGVFSGNVGAGGECLAWNAQGGDDSEGPGSLVSTWTCSQITFNSVFAPNAPANGLIGYNFSKPTSKTFSGLCVTARDPLPPPVGTPQQIDWQLTEIGCFIHFNMATSDGSQGCSGCGYAPPNISLWNPSALDTDAWIAAGVAMGCKRFIYVAKHACGFAAWNSSLTTYPYSSDKAPHPIDVVRPFVASAQAAGVGYGFYYTTVTNQLCNVCGGAVNPNPKPGQLNLTQAEYDAIVIHHLQELWGLFGPLAEVWFDGGYPPSETSALKQLFQTLQPKVVAFQAYGLMPSPVRWVGSESGYAPYPCWSTTQGSTAGGGDPNGDSWYPAETDFTLQNGDNWFYNPNVGVRSPSSLRSMYEISVGSNTAVIIDMAPAPDGSLPADQAAAAQTLGQFVRGCYGAPIANTSGSGADSYTLAVPTGAAAIDRIVVAEDQSYGQLIRAFSLSAQLTNGTVVSLFNGTSVGNKYTHILATGLPLASVTVSVTKLAALSPKGSPFIRNFSVHSCNSLAAQLDAEWEAQGWPSPPAPQGPPTVVRHRAL